MAESKDVSQERDSLSESRSVSRTRNISEGRRDGARTRSPIFQIHRGDMDSDSEDTNPRCNSVSRGRSVIRGRGTGIARARAELREAKEEADEELFNQLLRDRAFRKQKPAEADVIDDDKLVEEQSQEEPSKLNAEQLRALGGQNVANILHVATKSGNLKGTWVKRLKNAAHILQEIVDTLASRTEADETRRLSADNVRLRNEVENLKTDLKAHRREFAEIRSSMAKVKGAATPSLNSDAIEELKASLVSSVSVMLDARFAGIEERLLPERVHRPPLMADRRKSAAPTLNSASATPSVTSVSTTKTSEATTSSVVITEAKAGPSQPQTTTSTDWATVVKKGGKGKKSTSCPTSAKVTPASAPKPKQVDRPKLAPPKTAAVMVTIQPEAAQRGVTYAQILERAEQNVNLEELGIGEGMRIRRAATGARLLELPKNQSSEQAELLASKLRMVLDGVANVVRPTQTATLRITGLDDSVTQGKVAAAITRVSNCSSQSVKIGELQPGPRGMASVTVHCPMELAKTLSDADCLHLQLYRDPKDRYKKGQTKASLSLQHFLGFESGFTLDKESNTIAIICQDVTVVLAFETRERLIAWQVKVGGQLGSSKEFLVMIGGGGSRKLPAGPARLHIQGRRFALTSGVPPRLLGLWELAHLRRYGVVEGRFCFEGGSHCGKGEGLHMLMTDQAQDIADAFDQAAQGKLQQKAASQRTADRAKSRPNTRLSDFNTTDQSLLDTASALYEENYFGEDCGEISPFWPSAEARGFGEREYRPETEMSVKPPWSGADHVTLERCSNCLTKLGGLTQSSTVTLNTGGNFNPAWTMEAVPESSSDNSSNSTEYFLPNAGKRKQDICHCKDQPPQRPPKPMQYDNKKRPAPLPQQACNCNSNDMFCPSSNPKVGPYENYDVPKVAHNEVVDNAEYYDTPKRIKNALADDLFQVTKPSVPGSLVLKKKCGCILKFGSKKKPVIVESDENLQPVDCPCQKVTNWANTLISLPYCKRSTSSERLNAEHSNTTNDDTAIYATVDISRKTNRQSTVPDQDKSHEGSSTTVFTNYQNVDIRDDKAFDGPYANYENLEFALSLEYYENAKDLLKKAGVTQSELDALSANIDIATATLPRKPKTCTKCNHYKPVIGNEAHNKTDEYLLMEPPNDVRRNIVNRSVGLNPGYTPMSPNPNWSQSLKHPISKVHRAEIEKSLSIPTLNGSSCHTFDVSSNICKEAKRSSSVDSARLLEDLKEFDSSIGSHATTSSMETLRNLALENRLSSPCDNDRECYECCKSSGSENKTSEESFSKDIPHLRNKHMDNAAIKRSSSVPCKGGNRDSSSSNDSGVSSCSLKHGVGEFQEFEMPLTSGSSRYQYMVHKRMRGNLSGSIHSSLPRKSKSSDPLRDQPMQLHKSHGTAKSSSAEAEVPVLPPKQFKGVLDTHSTSSGTSDMSDYIETLSLTSSHSSSDNQSGLRISRQPTNTLRPRSGKEYHNLDPIITSMYKNGKNIGNYTNLP